MLSDRFSTLGKCGKEKENRKQGIASHPEYEVVGEPREFLYYSPYRPSPLKRREVQIPIRKF